MLQSRSLHARSHNAGVMFTMVTILHWDASVLTFLQVCGHKMKYWIKWHFELTMKEFSKVISAYPVREINEMSNCPCTVLNFMAKCQPNDGDWAKVKGTPKSVVFMWWQSPISVQNVMPISPTIVYGLHQISEPSCVIFQTQGYNHKCCFC